MRTKEEIVAEIKVAMIAISDFWQIDKKSQENVLEVANRCMRAVLRMLEDENDTV